jgi:hypothetical protein
MTKFKHRNENYILKILFDSGLSWRGNPATGGIGGICQKRAKFKNDGKVRNC